MSKLSLRRHDVLLGNKSRGVSVLEKVKTMRTANNAINPDVSSAASL